MATQDSQGIKLFGKTITFHGNITQPTKTQHVIMKQTAPKTEEQYERVQEQEQEHMNHQKNAVKSDLTAEKRPDKIIPCPRCKSMETKFCYFNNYNVNQPRHFCKGCQRYWTAGGALRNVPVGAGRRKNKPPGRVLVGGFSDVLGASGVHKVELDGLLVEEWQAAAAAAAAGHGGFRHDFPVKRLRCYSIDGQSC